MLAEIEHLDKFISISTNELSIIRIQKDKSSQKLKGEEKLLNETSSVNWITRRWQGLPNPEQQNIVVQELTSKHNQLSQQISDKSNEIEKYQTKSNTLIGEYSKFKSKYSSEPDEIILQEVQFRRELGALQVTFNFLSKESTTEF